MKRRVLSREERQLWELVTRQVMPLGRRRPPEPEPVEPAAPLPVPESARVAPRAPAPPARPPSVPPIAPLEPGLLRKLRRGSRPTDGVLDLHGMTQAEAHGALRAFLVRMQAQGASIVVVITGKGGASPDHDPLHGERGVLRRMVPHWLRMPDMRPLVLGFETAGPRHGGSGSLYVRLRRAGPSF